MNPFDKLNVSSPILKMSQPLTAKPSVAGVFTSQPPSPIYIFLFLIILCTLGFYTLHQPHSASPLPNHQTPLSYRRLFLSSATNATVSAYLRALTTHSHVAGTKPSLEYVQYVKTHFENLGFDTHTTEYRPLLSYPAHASVSVQFSNGTTVDADLNEPAGPGFGGSGLVQPYHAYSPSGSVRATVVYVNFGREEDYRALGVDVKGCVVLVRKGDVLSRGNVVEIAESKGALAVLLYADGSERFGGIERGTVMRGIGDPISPGWPGVEGGERLNVNDGNVVKKFPKIPSLPLSLKNAEMILGSLGGTVAPEEWSDSGRVKIDRVGPGPTLVNLTYQEEQKVATIHNVFAVIKGSEEPDRYVLLGNHRDAWTYGAVDPNSGTAALLDIARRYALLKRMGWNPRRTIILCSWDAEEFGLIGSTEWVEENLVNLGAKAVAYLNVDCAVQGPGIFAGATPQLHKLLIDVTKKVQDPDLEGATVYETWTSAIGGVNIQTLGRTDSDFAPFLQHAGVPSVDMYYGADYPVYHTAFDNYEWMVTHGDPLFHRHVAVAGIWGLLALNLADESVLPFDYVSYADQLQLYTAKLISLVDKSVSLDPLTASVQEFRIAAKEVEIEAKQLRKEEPKDTIAVLKARALNDRLMLAERGFLDADGLHGNNWFKHLVYGPISDHESKLDFFPGIADAISQSSKMSEKDLVQHQVWRVARAIQRSARALKGDFT